MNPDDLAFIDRFTKLLGIIVGFVLSLVVLAVLISPMPKSNGWEEFKVACSPNIAISDHNVQMRCFKQDSEIKIGNKND